MQPFRKQKSHPKFLEMAGHLENYISNYAAVAAPPYQLTRKDTKFKWEKEEEKVFRKIQDNISNDKTMTFFDPFRPIILRTETSYNQGLLAALLQKTDKGIPSAFHLLHDNRNGEKIARPRKMY